MVADYLEQLGSRLVQVARDEGANERELSQPHSDLRASGRLMKVTRRH
jgi:hypothetical protein